MSEPPNLIDWRDELRRALRECAKKRNAKYRRLFVLGEVPGTKLVTIVGTVENPDYSEKEEG